MRYQPSKNRAHLGKLLAIMLAAVSPGWASIAQADSDTEDLLLFLKEKGIMNDTQVQEFKARSEKRKKAEQEKQEITQAFQAAKDPNAVKAQFKNGITLQSEDGKNSIGLDGQVQLDYRNFDGPDAANADTFDVRRAQLGVKGKFWDNFEFLVRGDFGSFQGPTTTVTTPTGTASVQTSTSSHLNQAWLNVNWWKGAQFQFGQFKMPTTLEEQVSSRYTDFQERSFVDNPSLTAGRERGAQLHGVFPSWGTTYALAFSTGGGVNSNESDNRVDSSDILGRVITNFAEIFDNKEAVYHVGLSFSDGDIAQSGVTAQRTEGRGVTFFSPQVFAVGAGNELNRTRLNEELALAYGPVKFQAEHARVNFSGTRAGVGAGLFGQGRKIDSDIDAWYASVLWLITGEKYADSYKEGLFGRIVPEANFNPFQSHSWGAWELGLRYSKFDASDLEIISSAALNDGTGVILNSATSAFANAADCWTLGLKWILNPNTRVLLNYVRTDFDTPLTVTASGATVELKNENAITLRTQIDF
jgi:phosphate-selective porin OprO/OprP